mmetsp:Transcript_10374/g.15525  ORF Transcript_10374/g.15525 Transcript_10374/m.15525 type:complete len:217 (-) Transcript_10374:49-699(-)
MAQHGVARISTWSVEKVEDSAEASTALLTLSDSPETREKWNHSFKLEYLVTLTAVSLTMKLKATNTGDAPFSFNFLLHTYLKVPEISTTSISGLTGRTYIDKVADSAKKVEETPLVTLPSFVDRIYVGTAAGPKDVAVLGVEGKPLFAVVNEASLGKDQQAVDVVVWNPYEGASPGDLPPPAYKEFVCVEPGLVNAFHGLPPSQSAELTQKLFPFA